MLTSEKIVFILALWVLISMLVVGDAEVEIFLVLVTIGFIAIREFFAAFTTSRLKQKMNVFIYVFTITFVVLVGIKIINKLGL